MRQQDFVEKGNGCLWARYLDKETLVSNFLECNFAKLNNFCMKEASVCPKSVDTPRRKRSTQCNQDTMSECNATNSTNSIDPDNPLELIFNPEKKDDRNGLIDEAKREYKENYEGMDMKNSYGSIHQFSKLSNFLSLDRLKANSETLGFQN